MCHSRTFLKLVGMAKGIYQKRNHLSFPHHHGNQTTSEIVPYYADKLPSVPSISVQIYSKGQLGLSFKDCVLIVHKEKNPSFFFKESCFLTYSMIVSKWGKVLLSTYIVASKKVNFRT